MDEPQESLAILQEEMNIALNSFHLLLTLHEAEQRDNMKKKKRKRQARRMYTMPWFRGRTTHGAFHYLVPLLERQHVIDEEDKRQGVFEPYKGSDPYYKFFRLTPPLMEELIEILRPALERRTKRGGALQVDFIVAVSVYYLAHGSSYSTISSIFLLPKSTVGVIIREFCTAVLQEMSTFVQLPTKDTEWRQVAQGFQETWNFPHCIGSIDGKHVRLKKPAKSESLYHNYKKFFSISMMAVVDHAYK